MNNPREIVRTLEYRFAETLDLNQIRSLECDVFLDPWSRELLEKELLDSKGEDNWKKLYVAYTQARVWGYVNTYLVLDELQIMRLAVRPELRRQGVAEQLLKRVFLEAEEKGATRASLEVRESNLAARNLYTKLGFIEVGQRKNYYDNGETAILMDLNFSAFNFSSYN